MNNLTPESPRLSPIQAPRESSATLGLSGPSQPPRLRLAWACGTGIVKCMNEPLVLPGEHQGH